jgi:3D (Asp-Asp-Asp) domain-containing protein
MSFKNLSSIVTALVTTAALATLATGCGSTATDESVGDGQDAYSVTSSFTARGTGYYPDSSALEGGFVDRQGKKLRTLQQFLAGTADYVAVAMDSKAFKYGTRLRIHELDSKYGRSLVFRVVDTGGAFTGKGRTRIDICTASESASLDPTINGQLHIDVIDESSGSGIDDDGTDNGGTSGAGSSSSGGASSSGSGRACTGDGTCNPGNDGSGEICESGRCVSGCHTNAQCPGATTCQSGACR